MPSFISVSGALFRFTLLSLLLSINSLYAAEITPPRNVVETAAKEMTDRLISDREKVVKHDYYIEHLVDEILLPVIDHTYMARRVLAKNWRKTSNEQKSQFSEAFKHKVIRTYAGAFKAFNGETIVFEEARFNKSGKKASVQSAIKRVGAAPINVTYMLYLKKDEWLTYDVVIEGVSLVKSFRDQFSQSIEKHGLAQAISLLADEYKSENPTLKMAGHVWDPYINNQLPANGLAVHLVTTVLTRAGYQVEMEFMPWQKVSEGLSNGDVDISVASWFNETRAKELKFTDPYLENDLIIVKRKNNDLTFDSAQTFKSALKNQRYSLGVFKDYGYGKLFDEIAPYSDINYFKYCTNMMRDVATKKIDIALLDQWTATKNLESNKNVSDHLEIIPFSVIKQGLHATISLKRKDNKEIAEAFNETLNTMKKDGSYHKILKQYNFPQQSI
jgi:ABC-type transporter MlaC component